MLSGLIQMPLHWQMMTTGQGSLTELLSALPWRYLSLS